MAALEGEALLLGNWKNVQELEENVCLDELEIIVRSAHQREHRHNRFMAAIKGINIDEPNQEDAKERFDRIQRKVEAQNSGMSEEQLDLDDFGLDFEIEE